MKRDELKELGLTAEQVDGVMKIHGNDTEAFKSRYADYDTLKSQNEEYSKQIAKNDSDLKKLAKLTKDNEELNGKVTSLQDENKQSKDNFNKQLNAMKLNNAVDNVLNEHKARNGKTVKALLNMDSISFDEKGGLVGLNDQLENVEKDNPYLFDKGQKQDYNPAGNDGGGVSAKDVFLNEFKGNN